MQSVIPATPASPQGGLPWPGAQTESLNKARLPSIRPSRACWSTDTTPATTPARNISVLQPKLVLSARLNLAKHLPGTGDRLKKTPKKWSKHLSVQVTYEADRLITGLDFTLSTVQRTPKQDNQVGLSSQSQEINFIFCYRE